MIEVDRGVMLEGTVVVVEIEINMIVEADMIEEEVIVEKEEYLVVMEENECLSN